MIILVREKFFRHTKVEIVKETNIEEEEEWSIAVLNHNQKIH